MKKVTLHLLCLCFFFGISTTANAFLLENDNLSAPELTVFITSPECAGETGSIEVTEVMGGTPPYLFALNDDNFSSNMNFPDLLAGEYEVKCRDANGCEISLLFVIAEPAKFQAQIGGFGPETLFEPGETVNLVAVASELDVDYAWFLEDELFSNEPDISFEIQDSTTFTLRAFNANGCAAFDTISLGITPREAIFVPNVFSPNGDGNNDILTVFAFGNRVNRIVKMEIFNRKGNLVFTQKNFPPNDIQFGWDGNGFKDKKLNSQVFTYVLEYLLWNGEQKVKYGDVILML